MCPYASGKLFLALVALVALVILAMTSGAVCAVLTGKDGVIAEGGLLLTVCGMRRYACGSDPRT